jgi:hypothetical protein
MTLLADYASIANASRNEPLILKENTLNQFKVNASILDLLKSKDLIPLHHLSSNSLRDIQQVDINRDKNRLKELVSSYIKNNSPTSLANSKSFIDVKKENIYDREL